MAKTDDSHPDAATILPYPPAILHPKNNTFSARLSSLDQIGYCTLRSEKKLSVNLFVKLGWGEGKSEIRQHEDMNVYCRIQMPRVSVMQWDEQTLETLQEIVPLHPILLSTTSIIMTSLELAEIGEKLRQKIRSNCGWIRDCKPRNLTPSCIRLALSRWNNSAIYTQVHHLQHLAVTPKMLDVVLGCRG